jgi:hypothetical protein
MIDGKPMGWWKKCITFQRLHQSKVKEPLKTNEKSIIIQALIKKRVGPAGFEPATNGL